MRIAVCLHSAEVLGHDRFARPPRQRDVDPRDSDHHMGVRGMKHRGDPLFYFARLEVVLVVDDGAHLGGPVDMDVSATEDAGANLFARP